MTLIQPLLILLVVAAVWLYMSRLRSRLADRGIVVVIALAGILLIAFPYMSTALAHKVGVGRGVDLIIYLCLIGLAFSVLLAFSRLRLLEAHLTAAVRELALQEAALRQAPHTGGPAIYPPTG